MFPITFSSFGDIVAAIQVLSQIIDALSETRGSPADYQDLVQELQSLKTLLDVIKKVFSNSSPSVFQALLEVDIQSCLDGVNRAFETTDSYTLLGQVSSSCSSRNHAMRRTLAKVKWRLQEHTKTEKCRQELLRSRIQLLATLSVTAHIEVQDHFRRLGFDVEMTLQRARVDILSAIRSSNTNVCAEIAAGREETTRIRVDTTALRVDTSALLASCSMIVSRVQDMFALLIQLSNRVEVLIQYFATTPAPQVYFSGANVVYLTDLVGERLPIWTDFCATPEVLHDIILVRFKNKKCESLVQDRRYEIANSQDAAISLDAWESTVSRGAEIIMIALLKRHDEGATPLAPSCPFCETINAGRLVKESCSVTCQLCQKRFLVSTREKKEAEVSSEEHESNEDNAAADLGKRKRTDSGNRQHIWSRADDDIKFCIKARVILELAHKRRPELQPSGNRPVDSRTVPNDDSTRSKLETVTELHRWVLLRNFILRS